MIGYAILSAFIPSMEGAKGIGRWTRSAWHTRRLRRLGAAALAGLLVFGPAMPARAQGMPVIDIQGIFRQMLSYMQDAANFEVEDSSNTYRFLRQMSASYNDYKMLRSATAKLDASSLTYSLVNSLPAIDVAGVSEDGTDHVVIRPVFTDRERQTYGPQIQINTQMPDLSYLLSHLDFDMNTYRTPTDVIYLSEAQIASRAVQDGWASWAMSQSKEGILRNYWRLAQSNNMMAPADQVYQPLRDVLEQFYTQRVNYLQSQIQRIQSESGATTVAGSNSDSAMIGASKALQTLSQELAAIQNGTSGGASKGWVDGSEVISKLSSLDDKAQTYINQYAVARKELDLQIKREKATDDNVGQLVAKKSTWQPFSLSSWLSGSAPQEDPGGATVPTEISNAHLNQINNTASQNFKNALNDRMSQAQSGLTSVARAKASVIDNLLDVASTQTAADQMRVLDADMENYELAHRFYAVRGYIPDGYLVVGQPGVVSKAPGGVIPSNTPAADNVTTQNVTKAVSDAAQTGPDAVAQAVTGSTKGLSWQVLNPFLDAIDNGANALLGRSFNLKNWAQSVQQQG